MKKNIRIIYKRLFIIFLLLSNIKNGYTQNPVLQPNIPHLNTVMSLTFNKSSKLLASSSTDGTIKIWDVSTGRVIKTLYGHVKPAKFVKFGKNDILYSASYKEIKAWDIVTGNILFSSEEPTFDISKFVISNDENRMAFIDKNKIRIWDLNTYKEIQNIQIDNILHMASETLEYTKDDLFLMTTAEKAMIFINTKNGKIHRTISGLPKYPDVYISPDNKVISRNWEKGDKMKTTFLEVSNFRDSSLVMEKEIKINTRIDKINFSPDGKIIYGFSLSSLYAIDGETGTIKDQYPPSKQFIENIVVSSDGLWIATRNNTNGDIDFIQTQLKAKIKTNSVNPIWGMDLSKDNSFLATGGIDAIGIWDLNKMALHGVIPHHGQWTEDIKFISQSNKLLVGSNSIWPTDKNQLVMYDIPTRSREKVYPVDKGSIYGIYVCPGENKFITQGDEILLWDLNAASIIKKYEGPSVRSFSLDVDPAGKNIISNDYNGKFYHWDLESGKLIQTSAKGSFSNLTFCNNGKSFIGKSDETLKLFDLAGMKEKLTWKTKHKFIEELCVSDDNKLTATFSNNKVELWNNTTGELISALNGSLNKISKLVFSKDGKYLIASSKEGIVRFWDIKTKMEVVSLISSVNGEWLIATPDGYWDSSPKGGELVSMVDKTQLWSVDQFAIRNNRPDIIMERLGSKDLTLIKHYNALYKKRLKKFGLAEDNITIDYHVPVAEISNIEIVGKKVNITTKLEDNKYNLKQFNVFVNDVPLFGAYGKNIAAGKTKVSLTENIELTSGKNKIEISCLNEKGEESFRALRYVDYKEKVPSNLYFLGFGVSKYKNPSLNLEYAEKDAKDLAAVFEKMKGGQFANVFVKTITNEQVTPENIKKAKEFIKNAKPDDTFILFIAGHGMHDRDADATYYYLTSNADPKNLKATAADFETIEDLLQGIPPRNKLFLMDACESGEIDDEVQTNFIAQADVKGVKSRGMKAVKAGVSGASTTASGTSSTSVPVKRSYLYQKDRYIYNDLVRRSGAIVFSSSKGGELSYERSDIENGLFTEYIMKALTTQEADKDNNGIVSTDELREYVSSEVGKASGDLQHPTVDRDNIYQKFGFGVK